MAVKSQASTHQQCGYKSGAFASALTSALTEGGSGAEAMLDARCRRQGVPRWLRPRQVHLDNVRRACASCHYARWHIIAGRLVNEASCSLICSAQ